MLEEKMFQTRILWGKKVLKKGMVDFFSFQMEDRAVNN